MMDILGLSHYLIRYFLFCDLIYNNQCLLRMNRLIALDIGYGVVYLNNFEHPHV